MAGNRETYEQAMNAGHNAAWDQEWPEAIQAYGRAVHEFPDEPDAHIHLGLALFEVGRLDDALKVYTRAHQLSPQDPIPLEKSADVLERLGRLREAAQQYVNVAEIYFSQRDLDKTLSNWERATRLTPGLVGIHAKLAQLRERIGDNKGAIREYLILAYHFQRLGEHEKAMKSAQRALRLERSNSLVLNTIKALEAGHEIALPPDTGELRSPPSRRDESSNGATAKRGGREIGEADPLGPMGEAMSQALGQLASHVMERGELNSVGAATLQAMEYQRQGLYDDAIRAYQRAAPQLDHPALHLNLGVLLVRAMRPEESIKHLHEALSESSLVAGALHALGHASVQLNRNQEAVRYLIEAVQAVDTALAADSAELNELDSVYRFLLSSIESRSEEALAAINRRFLRMLEGKDWKQRIAETRRQIDETMREQGAEGAVDILVASRGDELTDSVSRIDRYIRQGMLILAMDEAHRAIEFSPHYLPVHLRTAEIMMREGRVRQAINKYNTVAKTYITRGENDRAAAILTQVLEMAPLDISIRQSLLELLEAEERWSDVIDQYIDLADTYHQLGNFEAARDTFSLAERVSQRTTAPTEKIVRIKHRMADIDQMRLDLRRAIKSYEEIIVLAPNDERAHRMLVDLNYRQGNQLEGVRRLDHLMGLYAKNRQVNKITQLLEELVTLYGNDTGLRSRLAAVYRELGRRRDAVVQLDALGELQLEAGLRKEAANTVRQIIALNPEDIEKYQQLLAQLGG